MLGVARLTLIPMGASDSLAMEGRREVQRLVGKTGRAVAGRALT